jgi:3-deoxy-D-manno-octulosonic-acid transferase
MNALDLAYALGAAALSPLWATKARSGWRERFGHTHALAPPTPDRPRLLLHAVSVGEVNTLRGLVPLLAPHAQVVVSVGTDTGLARAKDLFAHSALVVRYPLDFSRCVARFLDALRPSAVALVELEVWPNFVAACTRRAIPVAVINGRLSERSFRGYRRIRPVIGPAFRALRFAAVQDDAYAQRFAHMGVPKDRLLITDSMKWDSATIADTVPGAAALAADLGLDPARSLIVAGSTGPGEEALLHNACPDGAQLLCAPRKPERFDEAAAALPGCVRRSAKRPAPAGSSRFLLDSIGELRAAYSLADAVVVGRSFGRLFGSDPIEPIGLGKATLIGPAFRDFESIVRALSASNPSGAPGLEVVTPDDLPHRLAALLNDPARRAAMAHAGRQTIAARRGATARHAQLLLGLIARPPRP